MSTLEFYKSLKMRLVLANNEDVDGSERAAKAFSLVLNDFERTEIGAMCKMIVEAENYVEALCLDPARCGRGFDLEKHLDERRVAYETQQGALRSWDSE